MVSARKRDDNFSMDIEIHGEGNVRRTTQRQKSQGRVVDVGSEHIHRSVG